MTLMRSSRLSLARLQRLSCLVAHEYFGLQLDGRCSWLNNTRALSMNSVIRDIASYSESEGAQLGKLNQMFHRPESPISQEVREHRCSILLSASCSSI